MGRTLLLLQKTCMEFVFARHLCCSVDFEEISLGSMKFDRWSRLTKRRQQSQKKNKSKYCSVWLPICCFRSLTRRLELLIEKVSHVCKSYRSSFSVSETLTAEISVLCEWVNRVKPSLSATELPVMNLSMQEVKDLLASHKVSKLSLCVD